MKKNIFIVFGVLAIARLAGAQSGSKGLTIEGRDFYVGLPLPSSIGDSSVSPLNSAKLFISSLLDSNTVTVSYFASTGIEKPGQTYLIKKRRSIEVPLDIDKIRLTESGEIPEWKSAHITSIKPISVQVFSSGARAVGSYLALPINVSGKEYVIESYNDYPGNGITNKDTSSGFFLIVAQYDGTEIQIIPNATTKSRKQPGVNCGPGALGIPQPFTTSLQRGECYLVKSAGIERLCDISGSTVIASNPIVVIAGHENSAVLGTWTDTSRTVDSGGYMIEEMLPVEYWDTTGYLSIPFTTTQNLIGGGDEYRMFYGKLANAPAGYPHGVTMIMNPDSVHFDALQYDHFGSVSDVIRAVSFHSTNGAKFHVVQYDRQMQGDSITPTPSQMGLIPISAWRTSYIWHVPNIDSATEQVSYINLICNREDYLQKSIQISTNGGPLYPISNPTFKIINTFDTIPDHSDLIGLTIQFPPGDYYITNNSTSKTKFIVYNYGHGIVSSGGHAHSFSYATAAGYLVEPKPADTVIFKTIIDSLCDGWNICVTLTGRAKIKSITLIGRNNETSDYQSFNCRFSPVDDPDNKWEIDLKGTDSNKCFSLFILHPQDSAYAAIIIVDSTGNYKIIELKHYPLNLAQSGVNIMFSKDTIRYPAVILGDNIIGTAYFYNKGNQNVTITDFQFEGFDNAFTITKLTPSLPIILRAKSDSASIIDTLVIEIRFKPTDTLLHKQKMVLSGFCFGDSIILIGKAMASTESVRTKSTHNLLTAYVKDRQLIIAASNMITNNFDCSLYDILGRKITDWVKQEATTSQLILTLPTIPTGLYLLRVGSYSMPLLISQ